MLLALATVAAVAPGFRSPTGNISCVALPTTLLCSIEESAYRGTLERRCLRPNGSGVDWHGFELPRSRRGQVLCSGGALVTGKVRISTLAYGHTWQRGPFRCDSARTGVTCRTARGHGVFVSRASWRIW